MSPHSRRYAAYWRDTLADAELGEGAFASAEANAFLAVPLEQVDQGRVPGPLVDALFALEPRAAVEVRVVLRPYVYRAVREHGRGRGHAPDVITPLMTSGTVGRDGALRLGSDTRMARDLLEPQDRSAYTIGSIDALDAYLTLRGDQAAQPAGDTYIDRCDAMLDAVCPDWPGDEYHMLDHALIAKAEGGQGVHTHLLALYDHLRHADPSSLLFDRYAGDDPQPLEPCLPDQAGFSERLAHSGPNYALAPAQRSALAHLLAARHGEIVAVNGPPGTGKTSLLLSVVATLWAEAALKQAEPPIIVASSTNNQAVTNIIDAFGKDFGVGTGPFAGRWLPRLSSFGAYYPAAKKEKVAAERYQTAVFFGEIEMPEFLATAEAHYLLAAATAFPELGSPNVETVVAALHDALAHEVGRLREIEAAWCARDQARSEAKRRGFSATTPPPRCPGCGPIATTPKRGWTPCAASPPIGSVTSRTNRSSTRCSAGCRRSRADAGCWPACSSTSAGRREHPGRPGRTSPISSPPCSGLNERPRGR